MPKTQQRQQANPIHTAIKTWIASLPSQDGACTESRQQELLSHAPKRFTVYEPMAMLPSGSFTSPTWTTELGRHDQETCTSLWSSILVELSKSGKRNLTHLAINEGIPLHEKDGSNENVLRSPSGLRMLCGDFGPADTAGAPTSEDFDRALWVSTKQNGILQTWAPRWTMFSRGNIKEKARLVAFDKPEPKQREVSSPEDVWAVDMYAGIGYFVFSYASLGFKVLCWEINPWSVEGLRRGAHANRWNIKVVQGEDLLLPVEEVVSGEEQIVVFLESNEQAARRVSDLQKTGVAKDIKHVNGGLLPTSEPTWEQMWDMTRLSPEAWLHLHENVGVNDTDTRRKTIEAMFQDWSRGEEAERTSLNVEHVEFVKTFAPGVWHCVFDVHITRSRVT